MERQKGTDMTTQTLPIAATSARARRLAALAGIFLMGAALVFVAGFAQPQALHDAAHDSRHGLSFPCH